MHSSTSIQLCLHVALTLTCIYLTLPCAFSMTLNLMPDHGTSQLNEDLPAPHKDLIPSLSKRRSLGADSWSLCPSNMERVDCFYEYLRVYARLRKAASEADGVSVRNIGKRNSPEARSRTSEVKFRIPQAKSRASEARFRASEARSSTPESRSRTPDAGSRMLEAKLRSPEAKFRISEAKLMSPQAKPRLTKDVPCPGNATSRLCTLFRLKSRMGKLGGFGVDKSSGVNSR